MAPRRFFRARLPLHRLVLDHLRRMAERRIQTEQSHGMPVQSRVHPTNVSGSACAIATRSIGISFKNRSDLTNVKNQTAHQAHDPNVSSRALASFKSSVSKPS